MAAMPSDRPSALRFPPELLVLFGVVFINLVGFGIVVPLLPFFAETLDAAPWQVTLMFSAYSLGQFFAEPFWGRLSDRIGRKPVLLVTTAANTIGYLALAFAPDIWWAIGIRLVNGFGAGNISTVQGYVADVTPPAQRAGRMGLIGAAFGLGFIVGPAMGGLLAQPELGSLGYQIPLFVAAGMAALSSLGVLVFLKESRAKADPAAPRPARFAAFSEAKAHPVIARVLVVTLIYMAAFSGMESTFGLWSEARHGWGAREVGLAFMVIGVVSATMQGLVTGRLARRFGEARTLAVGMAMFGLSLLFQVIAWKAWMVPVIMAFGGFGMALAMPCISAIISRSTPPDRQGAMLGLNMAAGSLSRIGGPIVAGFLFSELGANAPFLISSLLIIPAVVMAINAGRLLKTRGAEETPPPAPLPPQPAPISAE